MCGYTQRCEVHYAVLVSYMTWQRFVVINGHDNDAFRSCDDVGVCARTVSSV